MERLGKVICTNDKNYKACAVVIRDVSSKRVSVKTYIVSPDDTCSDIITIPKRDICTKKGWCDFFFDMEGDFSRDDVDKIKKQIEELLQDENSFETQQIKATMDELHETISQYLRSNSEELSDNPEAVIFIRNEKYGYMRTPCMEDFIKENKELGYKRNDVLMNLKIMGVLQNGKDRPYDILVSVGGKKKRFYKFELSKKCTTEEKEDEVIEIGD